MNQCAIFKFPMLVQYKKNEKKNAHFVCRKYRYNCTITSKYYVSFLVCHSYLIIHTCQVALDISGSKNIQGNFEKCDYHEVLVM